jgi:hypothetical protein
LADASVPYAATLDAALQWLETWRQTGRRRHLQTALACARIVRALAGPGCSAPAEGEPGVPDMEAAFAEISSVLAAFGETAPISAKTMAAAINSKLAPRPAGAAGSLPCASEADNAVEGLVSDR